MPTLLRKILRGAAAPFRGLALLIRTPAMWPWALAPLLLTALAIATAFAVTMVGTPVAAAWLFGQPQSTGGLVLWWVGVASVALALFGLSAVGCWFVGNLAASPFYDVLAGQVEQRVFGRREEDAFSWARVLGDAWQSIRHSAAWLGLWLAVVVPLLLLHLVPVVGSALYAVLSYVATSAFVARELFDVPLSRRRTPFRDKLRYLRERRAEALGLGAVTALFLFIPLANLVVMPFAVVGASLLFGELEREAAAGPSPG